MANSPSLVQHDTLPCYDGTGVVKHFLANFMARIKLVTEDEEQQLKYLKCSLKGPVWDKFILYQSELGTIAHLQEWLNKQYGDTVRRHVAMGKILAMKQKPDEGVSHFTTRLLASWQDLHGTDWKINDPKAQSIFLGILFSNIKPQLLKNIPSDFEPDTVEDFLTKMRRIESETPSESLEVKFRDRPISSKPFPRPTYMNDTGSNLVSRSRYQRPIGRPLPYNVPPSRRDCTCFEVHSNNYLSCPLN